MTQQHSLLERLLRKSGHQKRSNVFPNSSANSFLDMGTDQNLTLKKIEIHTIYGQKWLEEREKERTCCCFLFYLMMSRKKSGGRGKIRYSVA